MKAILFIVYYISALTVCNAQQKKLPIAEHYKTRKFDVAIFPSSYHTLLSEQTFTPEKHEVERAENALKSNLKAVNKNLVSQIDSPILHKNLKKYYRQYFGYTDENGNRILLINCIWKKYETNNSWLEYMIMVSDGGSHFWQIKYNVDTDTLFDLKINGLG